MNSLSSTNIVLGASFSLNFVIVSALDWRTNANERTPAIVSRGLNPLGDQSVRKYGLHRDYTPPSTATIHPILNAPTKTWTRTLCFVFNDLIANNGKVAAMNERGGTRTDPTRTEPSAAQLLLYPNNECAINYSEHPPPRRLRCTKLKFCTKLKCNKFHRSRHDDEEAARQMDSLSTKAAAVMVVMAALQIH